MANYVFNFPTTPNEAKNWGPYIRIHELASQVLAVAETRIEGAWSAYCDAVPGNNHQVEYELVLRRGAKLSEHVARALFPELEEVPYAG